ncbi:MULTISPECIES: lysis system o-spanin lipoprotein Rz1 [unclassified Pantoea]|nr:MULTISPECIES: lysis system o-spanin lipoprotein Rz1 [unclassified Pantoea]MDU5474003.1 lysis system o-spanin lipoprotein Rz1 [Pantoea sp.]
MQPAPDFLTPLNGIISSSEVESSSPESKSQGCSITYKSCA